MKITNAEIIAVSEGSADSLTERRVLAAALSDPGVQRRLALLRLIDTEPEPLPELAPARLAQLQEALEIGARRVGREFVEHQAAGATAEPTPATWLATLGQTLRQALTPESRPLRLSALAPALAAPEDSLEVQRESFLLDGVRVEIHQLPETPPRLRFLLDASQSEVFLMGGATQATLALQEEGVLPLWLVTVPLSAQGRGLWEQPAPAVRGAVTLLGVALVGD